MVRAPTTAGDKKALSKDAPGGKPLAASGDKKALSKDTLGGKTQAAAGDQDAFRKDVIAGKMQELTAFIGEQVKAARVRLKLTQAEVAALAESSANQIFLVEAGKQNMTLKSLVTLALILEVEPSQFFPRPQSLSERPETKHVFGSIEDGCGRAKVELERIEGLINVLKTIESRRTLG